MPRGLASAAAPRGPVNDEDEVKDFGAAALADLGLGAGAAGADEDDLLASIAAIGEGDGEATGAWEGIGDFLASAAQQDGADPLGDPLAGFDDLASALKLEEPPAIVPGVDAPLPERQDEFLPEKEEDILGQVERDFADLALAAPGVAAEAAVPDFAAQVAMPSFAAEVAAPDFAGEAALSGLAGESAVPDFLGEAALPGLAGETAAPDFAVEAALSGLTGEADVLDFAVEAALPGLAGEAAAPDFAVEAAEPDFAVKAAVPDFAAEPAVPEAARPDLALGIEGLQAAQLPVEADLSVEPLADVAKSAAEKELASDDEGQFEMPLPSAAAVPAAAEPAALDPAEPALAAGPITAAQPVVLEAEETPMNALAALGAASLEADAPGFEHQLPDLSKLGMDAIGLDLPGANTDAPAAVPLSTPESTPVDVQASSFDQTPDPLVPDFLQSSAPSLEEELAKLDAIAAGAVASSPVEVAKDQTAGDVATAAPALATGTPAQGDDDDDDPLAALAKSRQALQEMLGAAALASGGEPAPVLSSSMPTFSGSPPQTSPADAAAIPAGGADNASNATGDASDEAEEPKSAAGGPSELQKAVSEMTDMMADLGGGKPVASSKPSPSHPLQQPASETAATPAAKPSAAASNGAADRLPAPSSRPTSFAPATQSAPSAAKEPAAAAKAPSAAPTGRASGAGGATVYGQAQAQLNAVVAMAPPQMQEYLAILRPWGQFIVLRRPDVDSMSGLQKHVEKNLAYFQANYLCLAVIIFLVFLANNMSTLFSVAVLVGAWALFMHRGGFDPSWTPKVAGLEMKAWHRLLLMQAVSLILLFLIDGATLFLLVGVIAMMAVAHAVFHVGASIVSGAPHPYQPVALEGP